MPGVSYSNAAPFWEFIASIEDPPAAGGTPLAGLFGSQGGCHGVKRPSTEFSPAVDVFDTPTTYVLHVSLPGAKKEDIGINYDEDKSELQISGVVHRNGDEEFLKTLKFSERNAGVFEKKVRLGDRRSPAAVDIDGITARLENGVLEVVIPKREKVVVEKRKVQID